MVIPNIKIEERIAQEFKESAETKQDTLEKVKEQLANLAKECVICLQNGHKIMIAGNGGSASDAQHFSAELVGRYEKDRKGMACLALTTDTSFLTAWSNDLGFEEIFSRQLESLGNEGDVFIGITTSGNSPNIIKAFDKAKSQSIATCLLTGKSGGKLHGKADFEINIQSDKTPRIQEGHILVLHLLAGIIEDSTEG